MDAWQLGTWESYRDGEIAIGNAPMTGRASYDYWALRNTGDFYLLQSLFEDDRDTSA